MSIDFQPKIRHKNIDGTAYYMTYVIVLLLMYLGIIICKPHLTLSIRLECTSNNSVAGD